MFYRHAPMAPALWSGRGMLRGAGLDEIATGAYPCPSAGMGMCPPFSARVEAWRKEVALKAGSKPIDFLMAWLQVESDGNPCSSTGSYEASIWQLMRGDNITVSQSTFDMLRPSPPCDGAHPTVTTSASRSSLTDDQAAEQIRAGMMFIDWCITYADAHLAQYSMTGQPGWTPQDWSYWALVKQAHAAPAFISALLAVSQDGNGMPTDFVDAANRAGFPLYTTDNHHDVSNAYRVGVFGDGGGSAIGNVLTGVPGTWWALGFGAVAVFTYVWLQKRHKKFGHALTGLGTPVKKVFRISSKDPATMTAGEINKELDKLSEQDSAFGQEMIDAGRGYERPSEFHRMTDPLSLEMRKNSDRRGALRSEISMRMGPGAPSRIPPGKFWGKRKTLERAA